MRLLTLLLLTAVNVSTALPMHMLGFSKGGVVLNQLVTELVRYSYNKKRPDGDHIWQITPFASTHQFFSAVGVWLCLWAYRASHAAAVRHLCAHVKSWYA